MNINKIIAILQMADPQRNSNYQEWQVALKKAHAEMDANGLSFAKNSYRCDTCGGVVVTLDIDQGTTSFSLNCIRTPGCKGMMRLLFYQRDSTRPHQYEWFKPEDLSKYTQMDLDHFERGGLDLHRRQVTGAVIEYDIQTMVRGRETLRISYLQRTLRQTYMTASVLMKHLIKCGLVYPERDNTGRHEVVKEVAWHKEGKNV